MRRERCDLENLGGLLHQVYPKYLMKLTREAPKMEYSPYLNLCTQRKRADC